MLQKSMRCLMPVAKSCSLVLWRNLWWLFTFDGFNIEIEIMKKT